MRVYAFVGIRHDDPSREMLNVLMQVRPVAQSGSGIVFPRVADDTVYSITLTDPDRAEPLVRSDFSLSDVAPTAGLKEPDTILSYGRGTELGSTAAVGDARQDYVQTCSVLRGELGEGRMQTQATGLTVPPPNVGERTTPA